MARIGSILLGSSSKLKVNPKRATLNLPVILTKRYSMTIKVVRDSLRSRKCAYRSDAEPVGDGMARSNSIYTSTVKIWPGL